MSHKPQSGLQDRKRNRSTILTHSSFIESPSSAAVAAVFKKWTGDRATEIKEKNAVEEPEVLHWKKRYKVLSQMTFPEILGIMSSKMSGTQSPSPPSPTTQFVSPPSNSRKSRTKTTNKAEGIRNLCEAFEEKKEKRFNGIEDSEEEYPNEPEKQQNRRRKRKVTEKRKKVQSESSDEDDENLSPDEGYCPCGEKKDGAFLVCCDKCSTWYHVECTGFTSSDDIPSYWECHSCEKGKPAKRKRGENEVDREEKRAKKDETASNSQPEQEDQTGEGTSLPGTAEIKEAAQNISILADAMDWKIHTSQSTSSGSDSSLSRSNSQPPRTLPSSEPNTKSAVSFSTTPNYIGAGSSSRPSIPIRPNPYDYRMTGTKSNPVLDILSSSPSRSPTQPSEPNSLPPTMDYSLPNTTAPRSNVPVQSYPQNSVLASILDPNFPIIPPQTRSTPSYSLPSNQKLHHPFNIQPSMSSSMYPPAQPVEPSPSPYPSLTRCGGPEYFSRPQYPPSVYAPRSFASSPYPHIPQSYPSLSTTSSLSSLSFSTLSSLSYSSLNSPYPTSMILPANMRKPNPENNVGTFNDPYSSVMNLAPSYNHITDRFPPSTLPQPNDPDQQG